MQQQAPQFMPPPPFPGAGGAQVPVWQQAQDAGGPPEVRNEGAWKGAQAARRDGTPLQPTYHPNPTLA